jgi:hypothetical protein
MAMMKMHVFFSGRVTFRVAWILIAGSVVACTTADRGSGSPSIVTKDPRSADPFEVVDCLLPGQIRQLGARATYVTERRPIRTTAEDCAIRGGEYVALDRADYGTALKVWMSTAQGGDPDAQYYVGVLYEKGADGRPNHEQAAAWYRKAAERGVARASMNLGRLYEQGLGVMKDRDEAARWYAKASGGLSEVLAQAEGDGSSKQGTEAGKPLAKTTEFNRLEQRIEDLNRELVEAQSRLAERSSLLEEEQKQLEQLTRRYEERLKVGPEALASTQSNKQGSDGPTQSREDLAKQQHMVQNRQHEIAELKKMVLAKESDVQQQRSVLLAAPPAALGLSGPRIELIDPPLVRVRGVRIEEGRFPIHIEEGGPVRLAGRVVAPGGLSALTVNGRQTPVDAGGTFTITIPTTDVKTGRLALDLVARDVQDHQGTLKLLLVTATAASAPQPVHGDTAGFGRYHALVIGNNQYREWTSLSTAVSDATAVSDLLKVRYGFDVTLLTNTARRDVLKALNELRKRLTERDRLLIYYAGHGFLEPAIDRGYWIPVEGDLVDNSDWIEFPAITDLLQLIPAQQVLVVADSCFAGKLSQASIGKLNPVLPDETRDKLLHRLSQTRIRTALTSGGAKPVLDEGGGRHSIFAQAFLGVLKENREPLEAERLFLAVRSRVTDAAKQLKFLQVPTYGPIHLAGHESLGDFVFVPVERLISVR